MDTYIDSAGKTRFFVSGLIFFIAILTSFSNGFYSSPAAVILVATTLLGWQIFDAITSNLNPGILGKAVFSILSCTIIILTIVNSTEPKNLEAMTICLAYGFLSIYCISLEKNRVFFWVFSSSTVISVCLPILIYNNSTHIPMIVTLCALAISSFSFIIHSSYMPLIEKLESEKKRAEIMTTITRFSREFHAREPEEVLRNIVSVTKQLGYISACIVSFDRRSRIVEDGVKIEDLLLYAEKASSLRRVVIESKVVVSSSKKAKHKIHTDIASAPIWFNSRYSAALIVQSAPDVKISDDDAAALDLLADQAGRALENAAKSASDRRAVERLLDENQTDKLTGIGNRRYADMMIASMEAGDVLAMIDVDGLKGTNDLYGHEAGDELLKSVGGFLRDQVRSPDLCARLGGDEFIILLKNAYPGAKQILTRLISLWEQKHLYSTTLSIGMSVHNDKLEVQETIKAADMALYQAKSQGKNRLIDSTK